MAKVFISYSRLDQAFVRELNEALHNSDQDPWVDWQKIEIGTKWWTEIQKGIEAADTFVFVVSPNSVASKVCGDEVRHALRHGKRFIPILRREVSGELFDQEDTAHQAINAHNWLPFQEQDNFAESFQKLIHAISHDLEYVKKHTKIQMKAIDWYENGSKEAFLLRSEELQYWATWLEESDTKSPPPTELQRKYIKISREVEDANQQATAILQKAVKEASQKRNIGLAILLVTFLTSVGSVVWAYRSISESQKAQDDAKLQVAKAEAEIGKATEQMETAKKIQDNAKKIQDDAQKQIASAKNDVEQAKKDFTLLQKKYQDEISKSNSSVSKVVEGKSKNGLIYIQVPTDAVKTRIQNLTTALEGDGYKAPGIEVVGKPISPDVPQIRYFYKDQKDRATKLQQDLIKINPNYNNFRLEYVPDFENKTKPEMMEIWFSKDAQ